MTRIIVTVLVLCAIVGLSFWAGGRKDRLRDEINNRDTLERMDDATDPDLDDAGVLDSLHTLSE